MKLKSLSILTTGLLLTATAASAGETKMFHNISNNPHEIRVDSSAVPAHLAHGDSLGACDGGGGGVPVVTSMDVVEARTYCEGMAMVNITSAINLNTGGPALVDANTGVANALVWRTIGAFGADEGQAYCGALSLGGGANLGGANGVADNIRDCVGVMAFDVPADMPDALGASIDIAGFNNNIGLFNTLSVNPCTYDSPNDGYDVAGDCIIDADDFGPTSFAAIHDVINRKGDNTTVAGSYTDVDFGASLSPSIALSYDAVSRINAARGGRVTFIVRCADETGHTNNRTPGLGASDDNAIILHDPAGQGFLGSFSTTTLSAVSN